MMPGRREEDFERWVDQLPKTQIQNALKLAREQYRDHVEALGSEDTGVRDRLEDDAIEGVFDRVVYDLPSLQDAASEEVLREFVEDELSADNSPYSRIMRDLDRAITFAEASPNVPAVRRVMANHLHGLHRELWGIRTPGDADCPQDQGWEEIAPREYIAEIRGIVRYCESRIDAHPQRSNSQTDTNATNPDEGGVFRTNQGASASSAENTETAVSKPTDSQIRAYGQYTFGIDSIRKHPVLARVKITKKQVFTWLTSDQNTDPDQKPTAAEATWTRYVKAVETHLRRNPIQGELGVEGGRSVVTPDQIEYRSSQQIERH